MADTLSPDAAALEVLKVLLHGACQDAALPVLLREKKIRAVWGPAESTSPSRGELTRRTVLSTGRGRDIYGQKKSTESRYFDCSLCKRQVAGSCFAAHVGRCLQRQNR